MTLLKIARMGHPVLWAEAEPLTFPLAGAVQRLIDDMIETMRDAPGVGLAAPQVYQSVRLIVVQPERGPDAPVHVLVNPVLEPLGAEQEFGIEGCLSMPDLQGLVPRYRRAAYRGFDRDGRPVSGEAMGFHARVLQHEVDHLDGILYPMRMLDPRDIAYTKETTHLIERMNRLAGEPSR
ncbi:MAG: peptide deformylase [Geminicoccaceae bacterium]|nr:MAG: peptide deformylase [Geminicoccaceae bacterium]